MSKTLRNPEDEARDFLPRYRVFYSILMVAAMLVLARLVYLQILEGNELREFSERNRVKESKIPAPRGLFLDREGQVLVGNLLGYMATISPQYASRLDETAVETGDALGLNAWQISSMVRDSQKKNGPFRPVKVKDNLTLKEIFRVKLLRLDHPGLNVQGNILRQFPLGENGAQLFGYVQEISKEQLERFNKKFNGKFTLEQGDLIGQGGLEEVWESDVRGRDGIWFLEVDARGREAKTESPKFFGLTPQDPVPGHNLQLTLDRDIQTAAYNAMKNQTDIYGPRLGSLIAMKSNGEVLAWVSTPSFDPNAFSTGMPLENWRKMANDPNRPLRNKVIQDHYSPGSTFKPIVALAALQEKVVTPEKLVFAPGQFKFGNRVYHDSKRQGHGFVNVVDAIERSSNVFFYKMGIELGIDRIHKYATLLGLGQRSNISMSHEASGLIPTTAWKKKFFGEEWQPGENLSNAIGQGYILATAIQMAVAYNTIGLGGKVYQPMIVKKILANDGKVLTEFSPKLVRDLTVPNKDGVFIEKRHFDTVREGLRRVANGAFGTARYWKIPGVQMAGKTGTSQVMSFSADQIYTKCETRPIQQRHHGWFIAFAPAENPEITVAMLAEHACHGNTGGVPIVREVVQAYMQKYHPELLKQPAPKAEKAAAPVNVPETTEEFE